MRPVLTTLLLLTALAATARANIWETGNPPGLRDVRPPVQGQIIRLKLIPRAGRAVVVHLPRPLALDAPLVLPPGDWTDLELGFDAPVQVYLGEDTPVPVTMPTLLVPLDDPEARVVTLDWTLPEGLAQALQAGVEPDALAQALADGVWATAR